MNLKQAWEVNFDGVVGPTHNYAGLSLGNIASTASRENTSNPREAALQGLAKMKFLADLGLKQAVFPPHERPALSVLRRFGFSGKDADILRKAKETAPELLHACASASGMWTANAATVTPSPDSGDGKVHFTPANLQSNFHRSIEAPETARFLRLLFPDKSQFGHHPPLSGGAAFGDEGAANHTRFCPQYGERGIHLFVYGESAFSSHERGPRRFPTRQTLEACKAITRLHQLPEEIVFYARQNPVAIDQGVFHNDVISVGNEQFFLCHEKAFLETGRVLEALQDRFRECCEAELSCVLVPADRITVKEAVESYIFNSQVITPEKGRMVLIAPAEVEAIDRVREFVEELIADQHNPLAEACFFDLRQSMRNGGGPACLRLRVVLTERELAKVPSGVFIDEKRYLELVQWVKRHYRESLTPEDLADPRLLMESRTALDELTVLLDLGSIYSFQTD